MRHYLLNYFLKNIEIVYIAQQKIDSFKIFQLNILKDNIYLTMYL